MSNKKQPHQPKAPLCLSEHNPAAALLTSVWQKKGLAESELQCSIDSIERKQSSLDSQQDNKVVMSKKQLMQFTKKFAINKIDFEEEIEQLKMELADKDKRLQILTQQVDELRTQEDYLIKVMEQLRDRHVNQLTVANAKYEANLKSKQAEVDHLSEELIKIRKWLEEQKAQARRCIQFLKIKDEIIENLEWDIVKYKNEIKAKESTLEKGYLSTTLKLNEINSSGIKARNSSTKKIIIRKERKEQNLVTPTKQGSFPDKQNRSTKEDKQRHDVMELTNLINNLRLEKVTIQNEKFEIFSKYRQATVENDCLRKALEKASRERSDDGRIKKSIDDLNEISKRIKESQHDKQSLLATKCLFLQKHVQKLTRQLSRVKKYDLLEYSETEQGNYEYSHVILHQF